MFENRTFVDLLRFNQVVQARAKALRDPVRHTGTPDQPSGTSVNTNSGSIDAAKAHLCVHGHHRSTGQSYFAHMAVV